MAVYHRDMTTKLHIILSTNVAETSITFDGVGIVIDSGFQNVAIYDHKSNSTLLKRVAVSKANANQRAGRTGRTCRGTCFRLYSKECFDSLLEALPAEIALTSLEFFLLKYQALRLSSSLLELDILKPYPPLRNFLSAVESLFDFCLITENGCLTPAGTAVSKSSFGFYASLVNYVGDCYIQIMKRNNNKSRYWLILLVIILDGRDNHELFLSCTGLPGKECEIIMAARNDLMDQCQDDGILFKYILCLHRYLNKQAGKLHLNTIKMAEYQEAFTRLWKYGREIPADEADFDKYFLKAVLMFAFKKNYADRLGLYQGYNERIFEPQEQRGDCGAVASFFIEAETLSDGRKMINSCFLVTAESDPELYDLVDVKTQACFSDLLRDLQSDCNFLGWLFRYNWEKMKKQTKSETWEIFATRYSEYAPWNNLLRSKSAKFLFFNLTTQNDGQPIIIGAKKKQQKIELGVVSRYCALISLETSEIHLVNTKDTVWTTARLILMGANQQQLKNIVKILLFQPEKCHNGLQAWIFVVDANGNTNLYELKQITKSSPNCNLSLISAIIGKRCECSVYDMLLNTVVDENTSNFICICKHNMVYEGVFENQRLIWHLRFVMQSEFTPRTEPG